MSKSSFYSGSGLTNTEQDAIEGAKNAAEAARDAAQAAQTAAETARDSAQSSSSTASGHADTATTKAGEAAASAGTATNQASDAENSASSASTSASNASDDADDAQKLAINAEDSQFTLSDGSTTGYSALHHKEKALDAQTAAETAKTGAETAKTAAEAAQTAAEAALADFEGVYLGPHASNPTQDANGDNVGAGDLYFNTTDSELLVYNGTNWVTSGVTTTATTSDNGLMSSSDKSKLDGIETGATADQTAAEIKTAYESNNDTNAFTDADHTKLDGIEASADVTDAANVDPLVDTHLNVSGASANQFLKYNGSDYTWDDVDLSSKLSLTGGTMTGNLELNNANIVFEGATADDYETTLTVVDPTADRTISLPNSDGVVGVISSSGYLSDITGVKINNVQINPGIPIAGATYMTTSNSASTAFQFYGKRTIGHSGTRDSYARIKLISDVTIGSSDKYVDLIGDIFLDGTFHVGDTSSIVFEGATEDGSQTTLTVTDPTADRTISLPDLSGTVLLTDGDGSSLTNVAASTVYVTESSDDNALYNILFSDTTGSANAQMSPQQDDGALTYNPQYNRLYTGSIYLSGSATYDNKIVFEGATDDDYETSLTSVDATADRTITLPDKDGEVIVANDGDISLISTSSSFFGPVLEIFHDSTSPANLDKAGSISWKANSSIGSKTGVATLQANLLSVYSSGITGELIFYTQAGPASDARLKINSTEILALENIRLDTGNTLIFEGATADDYETTLTVVDPTADRTISLPDASGTVLINTGDTSVAYDTDVHAYFGRAAIGHNGSTQTDYVQFGHIDNFNVSTTAGMTVYPTGHTTIVGYDKVIISADSASGFGGEQVAVFDENFGMEIQNAYNNGNGIRFDGGFVSGTGFVNTDLTINGTQTADRTIYLPDASGTVAVYASDGTNGQVLTTDGSGNLSFTTVSGGGGGNTFDSSIIFEGSTADDFETTLTVTDPTADRTITFGDQTGTVMLWQSAQPNGGTNNYAIGSLALDALTNGEGNVALGTQALEDLTTGYYNVGIGYQAALNTTTATSNVAIGYSAMSNGITTGSENIGIGRASLNNLTSGTQNVAVGKDALLNNTTGSYSVAVGVDALTSQTTGNNNVGIGLNAAYDITTGNFNVAVGRDAGGGSTGSYNTSIGYFAGEYNTSSKDYQVMLGYEAGNDCGGDYTVAIGRRACSDGVHLGSVGVGAFTLNRTSTNSANYNTAVGYSSGGNQYSGDYNIYMGYDAEPYYNNSNYGIAIGTGARHNHQWGVSVGGYAGGSMSNQGDFHTYIGSYAGYDNDGGDYHTCVGYQAGYAGGSGSYLTSIGARANYYASSNNHGTYVGYEAGEGDASGGYNVYVGYQAGKVASNGSANVCVGYKADTPGGAEDRVVAIGYDANAGYGDVSIGYRAHRDAPTSSSYSVVIGHDAGMTSLGLDTCVFVGYNAGKNVDGAKNVCIGGSTMAGASMQSSAVNNTAIGYSSLVSLTSGTHNTAVGDESGFLLTSGSNNTFLGTHAGYEQDSSQTNALTTGSNVMCLGHEAMPSSATATNEITLGDNDITSLRCNVQTISSLSDERDKTAIEDLSYGLDFINDMRPVQFTWNRRDGSLGATKDMGFIAQDLYDVELDHSSVSRTRLVNWENPEKLEADYVRSYPILVKAVQELSAKVDALTARVAELEGV